MTEAFRSFRLNRRLAGTDIAAVGAFGRRGGHQQLPLGDGLLQPLLPRIAGGMANEAGDFGLMHRIDHRTRRAGAPEDVADVDDFRDAGVLAAELGRNHQAEQFLLANGFERFGGETAVAVDRVGEFRRRLGRGLRTLAQLVQPLAPQNSGMRLAKGQSTDVRRHCVAPAAKAISTDIARYSQY
jgi:hypothetical protein